MAVTRIVSLSVCLLSVTTCLKPYEYRDCLFEPLPYLGPDQAVVYLFITREDVVNEASHVRISVDGSFVTGLYGGYYPFVTSPRTVSFRLDENLIGAASSLELKVEAGRSYFVRAVYKKVGAGLRSGVKKKLVEVPETEGRSEITKCYPMHDIP